MEKPPYRKNRLLRIVIIRGKAVDVSTSRYDLFFCGLSTASVNGLTLIDTVYSGQQAVLFGAIRKPVPKTYACRYFMAGGFAKPVAEVMRPFGPRLNTLVPLISSFPSVPVATQSASTTP
jgi:hypothetical protein